MASLHRLYSRLHIRQVAVAEDRIDERENDESSMSPNDSSGESSDDFTWAHVHHRRFQLSMAEIVLGTFGMLALTLMCVYVAARVRGPRRFHDIRLDMFPSGRGVRTESSQNHECTPDNTISCTETPSETCYRDDLICSVGGLGCNAGGQRLCRFCGFGPFAEIPCPNTVGKTSSPSPTSPPRSSPPGGVRERLIIVNGCSKDDMLIASFSGAVAIFEKDVRLGPGESRAFAIPNGGLAATRFWPKWGCDTAGEDCIIGQSGGPGETCSARGCAPPIDSKFEATFGCFPEVAARKQCTRNPSDPVRFLDGNDWWDVSQVDGWTLPYKVEVFGQCSSAPSTIDCSHLNLSACPRSENLGSMHGTQDLRLHSPGEARLGKPAVVGCFSPCGKLTYNNWGQGFGHTVTSAEARDFCCPTPPVSPDQCSAGPAARSNYTDTVHRLCPGVYAYAYDDGYGLFRCNVGPTYKVTFYCPA